MKNGVNLLILGSILLQNCDSSNNEKPNSGTVDELICDCFIESHEKIKIDFLDEIKFYKQFISEISPNTSKNLSSNIVAIYEEMQNDTFEPRLYDTTLQKEFQKHIDFPSVKNCITQFSNEKEIRELIETLDRVGMSSSYDPQEQIKILKSLEVGLKDAENVTWVEPMQINAFFYMYDRYNQAASEVKIDVLHDELLLPPPPPPPPMPNIPPPDDYEIEESEEDVHMDENEYDF